MSIFSKKYISLSFLVLSRLYHDTISLNHYPIDKPVGSFHCSGVLHAFVVRSRTLPVTLLALEPMAGYPSVPLSGCLCPLYVQLSAPVCAPCLTGCLCPLDVHLTVSQCVLRSDRLFVPSLSLQLTVPHYVCPTMCAPCLLSVPSVCTIDSGPVCTSVCASCLTGCQCPADSDPVCPLSV